MQHSVTSRVEVAVSKVLKINGTLTLKDPDTAIVHDSFDHV